MRIRFKPTPAQRAALRAQLARLEHPVQALEVLGPTLPADFQPASTTCSLQGAHSDRFVLRVLARSHSGQERACAVKVYSDDFGQEVWSHSQALAVQLQPNHDGPCLSTATWRRGSSSGRAIALSCSTWTCSGTPTRHTTPAIFWRSLSDVACGIARCRRTRTTGSPASGTPTWPRCPRYAHATCRSIKASRSCARSTRSIANRRPTGCSSRLSSPRGRGRHSRTRCPRGNPDESPAHDPECCGPWSRPRGGA